MQMKHAVLVTVGHWSTVYDLHKVKNKSKLIQPEALATASLPHCLRFVKNRKLRHGEHVRTRCFQKSTSAHVYEGNFETSKFVFSTWFENRFQEHVVGGQAFQLSRVKLPLISMVLHWRVAEGMGT
jgi:hypothetical protein